MPGGARTHRARGRASADRHDTGSQVADPLLGPREDKNVAVAARLPRSRPGYRCPISAPGVARQLAQLRAVVARLDAPDGAGSGAHDERLGARSATALVADALEDVAVRDARGGEEDVLPADEVVVREHAAQVVAGRLGARALLVVARPEPADERAADALDRRGRDHALGRAADAPEEVGGTVGGDGVERAGDVAVRDELAAPARRADRRDALLVARAVEDDGHHV